MVPQFALKPSDQQVLERMTVMGAVNLTTTMEIGPLNFTQLKALSEILSRWKFDRNF